MIVIFSPTRIEGLEGTYVVAGMATEIDVAHATVAYTDNERIIAMAKKLNVEVRDFPKQPPTSKGSTPPPPLKYEVNVSASVEKSMNVQDDIGDVMELITPVVEHNDDPSALTATSVPEVKPKRKPLSEEAKAKAAAKRKAKADAKKK